MKIFVNFFCILFLIGLHNKYASGFLVKNVDAVFYERVFFEGKIYNIKIAILVHREKIK